MGKATGGKPYQSQNRTGKTDSAAPTIAELGVDKKRLARGARLKSIAAKDRNRYVAELKAEGKSVTPNAVLAKDRQAHKAEAKKVVLKAAFSATGPFGTVVIDPPWQVEKIDRDVRPNQAAFDYPTMTVDEIDAFWREQMAHRIEPDCHLFMWTTNRFLPSAIKLIGALDFRYVLTMVWHKSGGFQPIDLPQYNCEFVV
jgi:hypothetical protein